MIPVQPEPGTERPYYDRICEHGKRFDVHCRECEIRGYCGCPECVEEDTAALARIPESKES